MRRAVSRGTQQPAAQARLWLAWPVSPATVGTLQLRLTAWEDEAGSYMQQVGQRPGGTLIEAMVRLYTERYFNVGRGHESIDGLVGTFVHDRDHYMRIIASVLPLLQMLATGRRGSCSHPRRTISPMTARFGTSTR